MLPPKTGQASRGGLCGGGKPEQHEHRQIFRCGGERKQRVRQYAPGVSGLPSKKWFAVGLFVAVGLSFAVEKMFAVDLNLSWKAVARRQHDLALVVSSAPSTALRWLTIQAVIYQVVITVLGLQSC